LGTRIRLLHIIRPSAGGMRAHLTSLVERLDPDRFEVIVATPKDARIAACLEQRGAEYRQISIPGDIAPHRDVAAGIALTRLVRAIQPDICHVHGFKAAVLARMAMSLPQSLLGRRLPGRAAGRPPGRPAVVYTVHNSVLTREGASFKGRACMYLERAFAHATDRVIAVSRALWQEYSSIPGLGPGKVRHIPNGVAFERFECGSLSPGSAQESSRRVLGYGAGQVLLGTASRLIPEKGVGVLLHAAAQLRRWGLAPEVLIAGDGPARRELEALSVRLGVSDKVRFLGFIDDMVGFYHAIDVFVLPSLSEGMPVSLIEAMAAGIPVVAARTPGVEEAMAPGTGRLAPPADPIGLAVCIRDAILRTGDSLHMAEQARRNVRRRLSIEGMVQATEEVYSEALAKRSLARPT